MTFPDLKPLLLVFGGGRMGLSHASMCGLLAPGLATVVVDPSLKGRVMVSLLSGRNVRVKKRVSDKLIKAATHVVISSPPKFHQQNVLSLVDAGFRGTLLIEKPISVALDTTSYFKAVHHGYTLRHHFFWGPLVEEVQDGTLLSLSVSMETNQDFSVKDGNWRSKSDMPGDVLLNEYGSHVLNLIQGLVPETKFHVIVAEENHLKLQAVRPIEVDVELIAASQKVRKSSFLITLKFDDREVQTDLYTYTTFSEVKSEPEVKSLAGLGVNARASLRGTEFSFQTQRFLNSEDLSHDFIDALETDEILQQVKEQMRCLG